MNKTAEGEHATLSPVLKMTSVTFDLLLNTTHARSVAAHMVRGVETLLRRPQTGQTLQNPAQFSYSGASGEFVETSVRYEEKSRREWAAYSSGAGGCRAGGGFVGLDVSAVPANEHIRVRVHAVFNNYVSGVVEQLG